MNLGTEKGETCGRNGCKGILETEDTEDLNGCSCHISPPCSYCMLPAICPDCEWSEKSEEDGSWPLAEEPEGWIQPEKTTFAGVNGEPEASYQPCEDSESPHFDFEAGYGSLADKLKEARFEIEKMAVHIENLTKEKGEQVIKLASLMDQKTDLKAELLDCRRKSSRLSILNNAKIAELATGNRGLEGTVNQTDNDSMVFQNMTADLIGLDADTADPSEILEAIGSKHNEAEDLKHINDRLKDTIKAMQNEHSQIQGKVLFQESAIKDLVEKNSDKRSKIAGLILAIEAMSA